MRYRLFLCSFLIVLSMIIFFFGYSNKDPLACAVESGELLRLHIIANSNTEYDQKIKFKVRDEIIKRFSDEMSQFQNVNEAENYVMKNIDAIKATVKAAGFTGKVEIKIGDYEFPDRVYGNCFVPAGIYRAVRIVLGEGNGSNWWCVMYPPLCFNSEKIPTRSDNIKFRSYFYDLWRKWKIGELK